MIVSAKTPQPFNKLQQSGERYYQSDPSVTWWAGFAGGHIDPSTGLVNDYHRWYDPATGGISFRRAETVLLVKNINEQSAGWAAGLRAGDSVVEVDGVRAGDLSAFDLKRILSTPAIRSLTVRRGSAILQMRLVLSGTIPEPPPPRKYALGADGRMTPIDDEQPTATAPVGAAR